MAYSTSSMLRSIYTFFYICFYFKTVYGISMALFLNNLSGSFTSGPSVFDQSFTPYIHFIVVHFMAYSGLWFVINVALHIYILLVACINGVGHVIKVVIRIYVGLWYFISWVVVLVHGLWYFINVALHIYIFLYLFLLQDGYGISMVLRLNNLAGSYASGPSVFDQSFSPYIHFIVVHFMAYSGLWYVINVCIYIYM